MLLSLESRLLSVPSSFPSRGPCERSVKVRDASAGPGRRSCANGNWGSPGTWEFLSSPRKTTRMGIPGDQPQARRSALGGGGSETRPAKPWYRQTKATKCGGRGGRKSQCLGSTEESGELGPRGPGGWEARQRVTAGCSDRIQGKRRIAPARRHSGGHPGVAWPWPSADHSARKACDSRPPRGIFSPQTLDRG